jgi:hypothetical protein
MLRLSWVCDEIVKHVCIRGLIPHDGAGRIIETNYSIPFFEEYASFA